MVEGDNNPTNERKTARKTATLHKRQSGKIRRIEERNMERGKNCEDGEKVEKGNKKGEEQ